MHLRSKKIPKTHFDLFKFFDVTSFSCYAECERQLRQEGLVHPNGTLQLQLQVKH
jgi:hypothetical protein